MSRINAQKLAEHHPEALVSDLNDLATLESMMNDIEQLEDKLATSIGNHGSSVRDVNFILCSV